MKPPPGVRLCFSHCVCPQSRLQGAPSPGLQLLALMVQSGGAEEPEEQLQPGGQRSATVHTQTHTETIRKFIHINGKYRLQPPGASLVLLLFHYVSTKNIQKILFWLKKSQ